MVDPQQSKLSLFIDGDVDVEIWCDKCVRHTVCFDVHSVINSEGEYIVSGFLEGPKTADECIVLIDKLILPLNNVGSACVHPDGVGV